MPSSLPQAGVMRCPGLPSSPSLIGLAALTAPPSGTAGDAVTTVGTATDAEAIRTVDFERHVEPILGRPGCRAVGVPRLVPGEGAFD